MGLSLQLEKVAEVLGCEFTLNGKTIATSKVFSAQGLLPGFLRRADQLSSFCLGYGVGVSFERSDSCLAKISAELNDKIPSSLRLLCIVDVLVDMVQGASSPKAVALDDLVLD